MISHGANVNLNFEPHRKTARIVSNISIPVELFTRNDSDMYKIRLSVQEKEYILSVPLCQLQSSRFQKTITAYMELEKIYHVSLSVPSSDCGQVLKPRSGKFKISLLVSKKVYGARPKLITIPDPTNPNDLPQNQSFLFKYWYIIVPVMIFLIMPFGEEPKK